MLKKVLLVAASCALALAVAGYVVYAGNSAPVVPPLSVAETAASGKPYVVKLHAQWCPVCLVTKSIWSDIEAEYSERVNLLVLDFTDEANTDASRAEARRLGLDQFFDEYAGATGIIVVLDGRTKAVRASIHGSREFADYRAAIDEALNGAATR